MYGDRANLYEDLWAGMKAYARQFAASDTPVPIDGELEAAFREFLTAVEAPSLPRDARDFYCREFARLIGEYRERRTAKAT